jgi:hypothetical protein
VTVNLNENVNSTFNAHSPLGWIMSGNFGQSFASEISVSRRKPFAGFKPLSGHSFVECEQRDN